MVHARVSEVYIHFALMYMTDDIFPVLTIKDMINEDGNLTKTYKLATGTNYKYGKQDSQTIQTQRTEQTTDGGQMSPP